MSNNKNIEFEDNYKFKSHTIFGKPQKPKIVKMIMGTGIIKKEKTAFMLLIVFVLLTLVLSAYIFYINIKPKPVKYNLSPKTIQALPKEFRKQIYESKKQK